MKALKILFENKRILKFGIIGLSGVGVNSGLLWLLATYSALPFYLCSFIAIETSIITNFLLNDIWTWSDRRRGHKLVRLLKYNLSTAFSSIFVNITVLLFLKEWVGMPYMLANLAGIGCGMLFNFYINHFWTYGDLKITLPRAVLLVMLVSLAWRLGIAAFIGAGFDEAYYFSYAIRPALSYFDHPPFVGFLGGFFPYLTGIGTAFTLRLGAVLLFTVSGLLLYSLAKQFIRPRQALFTYILFNLTPIFMLGAGLMILPDAGLVFFWILALLVLERLFIKTDLSVQNWVLAGIFTGFAMLAKYHGVLLGGSVVLFALIFHPRQFLRAGPYLYGLAALIVFLPVIIWNAQNDFVSFTFQGGRAMGGNISPDHFLQALGGQAAYLTPFIFFPLYYVMLRLGYRTLWHGEKQNAFFALFGLFPIVFVLVISLFKQILPHWTLPGYIVLMIPFGRWLSDAYTKRKSVRILSGFTVAFIVTVLLAAALHTRYGIFHLEKMAQKGWITEKEVRMDATLDAQGWQCVRSYTDNHFAGQEIFLFTHKWFLSGKVDLAVRGEYPVMCFNDRDARGFGVWDAALDMRGRDGLFICTNRYRLDPNAKYSDYFQHIAKPDSITVYRGSVPAKVFYFYHCRDLKKTYPLPYQIND